MPTNPDGDNYIRLAESDALWNPGGQPVDGDDDIVGQPVDLSNSQGSEAGGVAYRIGNVVHEDGHLTVEYLPAKE